MKSKLIYYYGLSLLMAGAALLSVTSSTQAADKKPNILVIWGDDIGQDNISAYHRGLMGGRTPNIDRIAKEGAVFTDAYGQQSCTAGRASFILGQNPFRTGLLTIGKGSGRTFDEVICDFAGDYADQAERDHQAFVKAVRERRFNAVFEA